MNQIMKFIASESLVNSESSRLFSKNAIWAVALFILHGCILVQLIRSFYSNTIYADCQNTLALRESGTTESPNSKMT